MNEGSGSQSGCAAAPMHMAMWGHGRVDADEGSIIDAILAIPAYTIKMAGIHGLPDDYMMQISARGSAYKPDIDWLRWECVDCCCLGALCTRFASSGCLHGLQGGYECVYPLVGRSRSWISQATKLPICSRVAKALNMPVVVLWVWDIG